MEKKKLEQFKKKLESRQQELRRNVSRTEQDGRSADEDTAQDIADRAASSYNKEEDHLSRGRQISKPLFQKQLRCLASALFGGIGKIL